MKKMKTAHASVVSGAVSGNHCDPIPLETVGRDSEIIALFRHWRDKDRWVSTVDLSHIPSDAIEAFLEPHYVELEALEQKLARSQPTTAAEVAAVVLAVTKYGDMDRGLLSTRAGSALLHVLRELVGIGTERDGTADADELSLLL